MKDSGMSDSSFYRFQSKIQKKMEKYSADLDSELGHESIKERFRRNTKPVQKKKSFWEKIKGYFYAN